MNSFQHNKRPQTMNNLSNNNNLNLNMHNLPPLNSLSVAWLASARPNTIVVNRFIFLVLTLVFQILSRARYERWEITS